MPKIYIMNQSGDAQFYHFKSETIYIGRSGNNDIQINDRFVSRLHLKVNQVGNRFFIKDLKSKNGTFVNGKPLIAGIGFEVDEGVPIVIGTSVICLGDMPVTDARSILQTIKSYGDLPDAVYDLKQDRAMTHQKNLDLMNRVLRILSQPIPVDSMLGKVLDRILDFFYRIDKCAVILIDHETQQISKAVVRCQDEMENDNMRYCQEVVNCVLSGGNAVVIPDTGTEADEHNLSNIFKLLKIGSVVCLPLMNGTQLEGVLYVDSVDGVIGFRKDDVSMLTSMSAAIATTLENSSWQ